MSAEPSNISNVSNTSNTSNTDSDAPGGGSTALAAQTALEGFALPAGTTHAQLFAALQASSARTPPACRLLGTFRDGVNDEELVERGEEEKGEKGEEEEKRNRMALCCPRSGCGSTVLLKGTAKLVRGVWIPLEPAGTEPHPLLPNLPSPGEDNCTDWWLMRGSVMTFENVGFSKGAVIPDESSKGKERKVKFLICGECDLGPIGWKDDGPSSQGNEEEFWIAPGRVGYR